MTTEISKPAHCATCGQGKIFPLQLRFERLRFHAVASLLETISALTMANARATAELAGLHAAHLHQGVLPTPATLSAPPATTHGSGAGSIAAYEQIMAKYGRGRLGRTHMEDVDQLAEPVRAELDCYLRRTIHKTFPVGGAYCTIDADKVFAMLTTFGLRMEDRGPMADATVFDDSKNYDTATIRRMQNFGRHYFTAKTNKYEDYWKGLAIETLIEVARYRGLFGSDGFLTAAK